MKCCAVNHAVLKKTEIPPQRAKPQKGSERQSFLRHLSGARSYPPRVPPGRGPAAERWSQLAKLRNLSNMKCCAVNHAVLKKKTEIPPPSVEVPEGRAGFLRLITGRCPSAFGFRQKAGFSVFHGETCLLIFYRNFFTGHTVNLSGKKKDGTRGLKRE